MADISLDDSLFGRYIRAIENPDSIGFKNGIWQQSSRKGDDPNNRGFGVDIKYNDQAIKLTKGRKGQYLTEAEERKLRNDHMEYVQKVLSKYDSRGNLPISEMKKSIAAGMLYRGDGMKSILNNAALNKAYYNGTDEEFASAVSDFYMKKGMKRRANLHNEFVQDYLKAQETRNQWTGESYTPVLGKVAEAQGKEWKDLSMKEKSDFIGLGVKNGVTDINEIKKAYYEYRNGGLI